MLRLASGESLPAEAVGQLRERLDRLAYEVRAVTTLAATAATPAGDPTPALAQLTPREWQVVSALQQGARGNEVAHSLNVAPSTERNHLTRVYRKLGVKSQVELLANAQPCAPGQRARAPATAT